MDVARCSAHITVASRFAIAIWPKTYDEFSIKHTKKDDTFSAFSIGICSEAGIHFRFNEN